MDELELRVQYSLLVCQYDACSINCNPSQTYLCIGQQFIRLNKCNDTDVEITTIFVQQLTVPIVQSQVRLQSSKDYHGKPAGVCTGQRWKYFTTIRRRCYLQISDLSQCGV